MDSRDHKKERKSPASGLDSRMNSSDVSNAYTGDSITTGGPSKRCTRANSGIDAPLSDKQNKPRRNSFKPKGKFWRRPFGSITCQKETDGVKERRMCIDDAPYEETATDLEQWSEKEPFITSVWKVATNAFLDPPKYKQPRTAQKTLKVLGRRILGHRRPFDDTSDHENLSDDEDAKSFSSDSSFGDKYFEEEMQVLRQHRRLLEQKVRNVKDLAKHCTRKHQDYMTTLIDHWEGLSTQPPKEIDNTSEDPKKKFWSATPVDIRAMWRQNSELFQQRVRNLEQYFAQVTQQYIRCHDTVSFLERNFQTQRVGRRVYAVILELERNRYRLHLCQQSIVDITHNLFTPRRLEGPAANTEPGCRVWDCPSPQKCVNINAKLREMTGHFKAMKLSKPNQLLPLKVLPPKTFCNSPENRTWQQGPSGCDLLRPMLVVRLREHQSVRLSERSADRADSRLSGVDLRSEEAQLSPKARESPKIQEGSSPSTKLRTRKRKHRSPPMEAWWTEKRDGVLCDKENAQPKVRKLTPVRGYDAPETEEIIDYGEYSSHGSDRGDYIKRYSDQSPQRVLDKKPLTLKLRGLKSENTNKKRKASHPDPADLSPRGKENSHDCSHLFNESTRRTIALRRMMYAAEGRDFDEVIMEKIANRTKPKLKPWPGYHYYK